MSLIQWHYYWSCVSRWRRRHKVPKYLDFPSNEGTSLDLGTSELFTVCVCESECVVTTASAVPLLSPCPVSPVQADGWDLCLGSQHAAANSLLKLDERRRGWDKNRHTGYFGITSSHESWQVIIWSHYSFLFWQLGAAAVVFQGAVQVHLLISRRFNAYITAFPPFYLKVLYS